MKIYSAVLSAMKILSSRRLVMLAAISVATLTGAAIDYINPADCIDADIMLKARTMKYFESDGSQVCLLEGECTILFGPRRLSADNIVLWIDSAGIDSRQYRRIEAHMFGNVKITEPGDISVEDIQMVVTLMQTGRFIANVEEAFADQGDESLLFRQTQTSRKAALAGLNPEVTPPSVDVSDVILPLYAYQLAQRGEALPQDTPAKPQPEIDNAQTPQALTGQGSTETASKPAVKLSDIPTANVDDIPAKNIRVSGNTQPVRFSADELKIIADQDDSGKFSQQVTICKGNLLISYGGRDQSPAIDVQANTGVLFSKQAGSEHDSDKNAASSMNISSAYLEGDVRMTSADRIIRAEKIYIDFETEQATLINVVAHSVDSERRIPIYVRAKQAQMITHRDEIGQVTSRDITLESPKLSISEFYKPTYYIGATKAVLKDTTPRTVTGEATEALTGGMKIYNPALFVYGVPVAYWPYMASDRKVTDLPLSRVNITRHSELGQGVETRWKLLSLMGLHDPEGFETYLDLSSYSDGPEIGLDIEYERDNYAGFLEGSIIRDNDGYEIDGGETNNSSLKKSVPLAILADTSNASDDPYETSKQTRYQYLWRHKHFLDKGWLIQLESANERGDMMYKLFRDDYWEEKPRDNSIYIRKQENNWALSMLTQAGIFDGDNINQSYDNDWLLPQISGEVIGQSLFGDTVTLFTQANTAMRRDNKDVVRDDGTDIFISHIDTEKFRPEANGRMELNLPVKLGPVNFIAAAGSIAKWEDYDHDQLYTAFGSAKINTTFWRVWQGASSRLLNIHKLRHLVTPELVYYYSKHYYNNEKPEFALSGFNPDHNDFTKSRNYGTSLRLKQRWQTYRGSQSNRQIADLAGLNIAYDYYPSCEYPCDSTSQDFAIGRFRFDRPELSKPSSNNINGDMYYNFSKDTVLLADGMFDTENANLVFANLGIAVQRNPRFRYYLGGRYLYKYYTNPVSVERWSWDMSDSFVGTAGFTYNIGRKYQLNFLQQYDFEYRDGRNLQTRVTLQRSFPRWKAAISLVSDKSLDMNSFEFSLYPEGMPKTQIGSRVSTWQAAGAQ